MSARNGVRARKNKERSKNFTELEKRTVLELISQHREVLRQGRSNNAANKSKQLVWSQICAEVNNRCQAECPRTPAQVKMWYENYKKKCKMRHIEPGAEDSTGLLDGMLWRNINPPSDSIVKDERIDSVVIMDTADEHLPINMSSDRLADRDTREIDPIEPTQLVLSRDHPHIVTVQSPGAASPIVKQESPPLPQDIRSRSILDMTQHITNPCLINQDSTSNVPLNLSHLEPNIRIDTSSPPEEARDSSPSFSNMINYTNRLNLPSSQIFPNKKHPKPRGYYSRAGNSQENGCCDRPSVLDSVSPHNTYHNNNNLGSNFCSNTSPTEEEKLYYLTKRQHAIYEHDLRMKTLNMELKNKEEVFSLQKQLFLIELKLKMDFLEKNSNQ